MPRRGTLAVVSRDGDEGATVHQLDERRTSQPNPIAEPGESVDAGEELSQLEGLLARARRHDPAALRQLFELHKDRVAAQVQRMTGDPASVDDLVQEVFIAAFANLASFRGDSQFRTWLYRIATNKVRNWWDSDQRRRRREHRSAELVDASPATPQEDLETRRHREQLYTALGGLSAKLREAFVAGSGRRRWAEDLLCKALGIPGHTEGG